MTRPPATDRALQRLIFAACRQLGLDDEARRDMQVSVTGKASLRDMTPPELKLVVDRLKSAGFDGSKPGNRKHKPAPRADLRLIHALWGKLGRAGKLDRPGRAGLNAFIRARFGDAWGTVPVDIDALRDHQKIDAVVQALLTWCRREGLERPKAR